MAYKIFSGLLFLFCVGFFSGCVGIKSAQLEEVEFEDKNTSNEIVITDEDIGRENGLSNSKKTSETSKILDDNSELVTMYDGYGNKTETRYFKNHSRLDMLIVRTAADGTTEIIVHGFGGDKTSMPGDFAEIAINGAADEIANSAKLRQTRSFKSSFASVTPTPAKTPTQEIRPVEQIPQMTEETTNSEENSGTNSNQPQNPQLNEDNNQ